MLRREPAAAIVSQTTSAGPLKLGWPPPALLQIRGRPRGKHSNGDYPCHHCPNFTRWAKRHSRSSYSAYIVCRGACSNPTLTSSQEYLRLTIRLMLTSTTSEIKMRRFPVPWTAKSVAPCLSARAPILNDDCRRRCLSMFVGCRVGLPWITRYPGWPD